MYWIFRLIIMYRSASSFTWMAEDGYLAPRCLSVTALTIYITDIRWWLTNPGLTCAIIFTGKDMAGALFITDSRLFVLFTRAAWIITRIILGISTAAGMHMVTGDKLVLLREACKLQADPDSSSGFLLLDPGSHPSRINVQV